MPFVGEGSPANASSVEAVGTQVIQIVDWLSPSDHLVTGEGHVLNILWCISWLHLFGPHEQAMNTLTTFQAITLCMRQICLQ